MNEWRRDLARDSVFTRVPTVKLTTMSKDTIVSTYPQFWATPNDLTMTAAYQDRLALGRPFEAVRGAGVPLVDSQTGLSGKIN